MDAGSQNPASPYSARVVGSWGWGLRAGRSQEGTGVAEMGDVVGSTWVSWQQPQLMNQYRSISAFSQPRDPSVYQLSLGLSLSTYEKTELGQFGAPLQLLRYPLKRRGKGVHISV